MSTSAVSAGMVMAGVAALVLSGCAPMSSDVGCTTAITLVNENRGISVELTEASAQTQLDGRVIALFATDYSQEGMTGLGRQPELTADGNLVWIDVGDPRGEGEVLSLQVGDVVEFGTTEPPTNARHWTPSSIDTLAGNAAGTIEIRQLNETICVVVDLVGDEFSLTGTLSTPLEVAG